MGVSVPPRVWITVGTPAEKSMMSTLLVDWNAMSPRCVNGLMPIANGTGCAFGAVFGFGRANAGAAVIVVKSITEIVLSPLLVTTAM